MFSALWRDKHPEVLSVLSHHYSGMECAVVEGAKPHLAAGFSSSLPERASAASQVIKHTHKYLWPRAWELLGTLQVWVALSTEHCRDFSRCPVEGSFSRCSSLGETPQDAGSLQRGSAQPLFLPGFRRTLISKLLARREGCTCQEILLIWQVLVLPCRRTHRWRAQGVIVSCSWTWGAAWLLLLIKSTTSQTAWLDSMASFLRGAPHPQFVQGYSKCYSLFVMLTKQHIAFLLVVWLIFIKLMANLDIVPWFCFYF